ncbi:MAG: alpha/beta hydrolase [Rubrivivax sp.]|nr:MAG: alpha/beta hydrolase [Rubrivivax sp.]
MPYQAPRVLIIPGLHDSGPAHWQTWLQSQYRDARRVTQRDPSRPQLERWAERIQRTLEVAETSNEKGEWLAVAHSFGCLALARHLADHPDSHIREALFVAPAEPDKFGLAEALPHHRLPRRSRLIASSNDPWMSAASAARWAHRWGASYSNLGAVGHINAEAGFGPLPVARSWIEAARARHASELRPRHAEFREWAFAV